MPLAEDSVLTVVSHSRSRQHVRRWLRSPKGLFTLLLAALTIPAAAHSGWVLVAPGLLAAIVTSMVLDAPLIRWRDGSWSIPDGAMLTGWLVGIVLTPHVSWTIAAATAALAIVAKHCVRVKRANVFNPAAAGLVLSYYLFDTGQNWWGAMPELPLYWLPLLVGTAGFMAWRLNKLALVMVFLGAHFTFGTVAAFLGNPSLVAELYRAPDVHMAIFFAGFMATDPPTSPPRVADQVVYGLIAAIASFVLFMAVGAVYFLLGGLLAANLWEGWRKWKRANATRTRLPSIRDGWTTMPTGT